jgi:hypothetical protein
MANYAPEQGGAMEDYREVLRMELGGLNAEWRRLQRDPIRSAIKTRRLAELQELRLALCIELFDTREPLQVMVGGRVEVDSHAQRKQRQGAQQEQGSERAM